MIFLADRIHQGGGKFIVYIRGVLSYAEIYTRLFD